MQNTESPVEGHGLHLHYGSVEDGDIAGIGIGREIQAALKRHHLATKWDGSLSTCVVIPLDWKLRRPIVLSA
jgi:hypothetical protein